LVADGKIVSFQPPNFLINFFRLFGGLDLIKV